MARTLYGASITAIRRGTCPPLVLVGCTRGTGAGWYSRRIGQPELMKSEVKTTSHKTLAIL